MLVPRYPVVGFWLEMMLRTARRTLLLYRPKFGSSPEARKTINPRPVTPGPCWPSVQSPFSVCVFARYCKPLSYSSRTSRGTASPMRALGGWALTGAMPPTKTSPTARIRDMLGLLSASPSCALLLGRRRPIRGFIGLVFFVRQLAGLAEKRLQSLELVELPAHDLPLRIVEERLQFLFRKPAELIHDEIILCGLTRLSGRLRLVHQKGDELPPLCIPQRHPLFEDGDRKLHRGTVMKRSAFPGNHPVPCELVVGERVAERFDQERIDTE